MTARESDARAEIAEVEEAAAATGAAPGRWVYRDIYTGEEVEERHVGRIRGADGALRHPKAPPPLTPEEQMAAGEALRKSAENAQTYYPQLVGSMLARPDTLWLLPEVQLMLSEKPNEASYNLSADLLESVLENPANPGVLATYQGKTIHGDTQQLFWNKVGDLYDEEMRDAFITILAQLSEDGADNVASLAMAWAEERDMDSQSNREQLLLNIHQWAYSRQQFELGQEGFLAGLDQPQEFVENAVRGAVDIGIGLFGSAEEAARRRGLTLGQQLAYQFGVRPPDSAGEFGAWNNISGAVDAYTELALDPLNLLAGVGAAAAATKTVPLASKATKAARLAMAARSVLPRWFAGATRGVKGGRTARILYSFSAKSYDELMAGLARRAIPGRPSVAEDILRIVKDNNPAEMARRYPQFSKMTDDMWDAINRVAETPEEVVEVLKAGALNDVLRSGVALDEAERAAREGWEAYGRVVDASGARAGAVAVELSNDELALVDEGLRQFSTNPRIIRRNLERLAAGQDIPVAAERAQAEAVAKWYHIRKTPTSGLYRGMEVPEVPKVGETFDIAVGNATTNLNEASSFAQGAGRWVVQFGDDTPAAFNPNNTNVPIVSGRFIVTEVDESAGIIRVSAEHVEDLLPSGTASRIPAPRDPSLLAATPEIVHHDLALEATRRQLQLNALKARPSHSFIISDIPRKPKAVAWNTVMSNIKTNGRIGQGIRRTIARATPGRPPDELEIFNTRKAMVQLRQLFEHYGMREDKIDELINSFLEVDLGARQDWLWDVGMRELGAEIGVPVLQHNLVTFYKGGNIRKFSGADLDLYVDAAGVAHRMPLLSSHMSAKIPIPLDEMDEIVRRAKSIENRSKLSRAIGWNGRGLGETKARRSKLVENFRRRLSDKGDEAASYTDDQLWDMAYSYVAANGLDGRGWATGKAMPVAGSVWNKLHRTFTKSMLIFRPIQWMWRVAILEEPIRAHIFNMPSMYTNPLEYMGAAREAHYITKLQGWKTVNSEWARDAYRTLTAGARSAEDITDALRSRGLLDDVFPDGVPESFTAVKDQVRDFLEAAVYGRTRINRLDPIKRVGWAVKNRAKNIQRAERYLKELGLPSDFDLVDDVPEIQGLLMKGYLAGTVGASDVRAYQWAEGMTDDMAFTYGQVYGAKLAEFVEDGFGRTALRRLVARLRGKEMPPGITGEAIIDSSRWELMRPDLQRRFPDIEDEVELANKYMDELLDAEARYLFEPFMAGRTDEEVADFLEGFIKTRTIETELGGKAISVDLRSRNHGDGVRQMGEAVQGLNGLPVRFPRELAAPSMDARFLAGQKRSIPDKIMAFFGEGATQTLNRRPAWVREYKRWHQNYTKIGVPDELAQALAKDHASKMVNYVFFNMEEAPYLAEKLNRYIPFFGATYEVLSSWTYKMPVAVGGTWPTGVGEFGRKFRRLMDAFVNTGLVTREEDEDGTISHTLHLVPSDSPAHPNEIGQFFSGAGHKVVNTLESTIATILGMEDGLGLRSQGYRLSIGDPLNLRDYGVLSFAQANLGLSPVANLAVTALAGVLPGAADSRRTVPLQGETLAELAERLDVDVNELVRLNRGAFVDTDALGSTVYTGILAGVVDPAELVMPEGLPIEVPESDVWSTIKDVFMPFGDTDDINEFGLNYLPGSLRWMLAGLGLQAQPADSFWKGEYTGVFAGLASTVGRAQISAQLSEAFMYIEAHNVIDGKGPFARIQEKYARLESLVAEGKTAEANSLRIEIEKDEEHFLEKVQKTAAESLMLRSMVGQMLPTSPGHVRKEHELIQSYWNSRDYADSLKAGDGTLTIQPFQSIEEVDNYFEQVAAWLGDATGDEARGRFAENYPQLMAYLTPKTYYAEAGIPPEIASYEEYQNQIEAGERIVAPLHVTLARARSASIQADYYNDFIARFGNDPQQSAANALWDRQAYNELQDERNLAYQGLYMWDDMHGGLYDQWQQTRRQDDDWALERVVENLNTIRDNLGLALELDDTLDITMDLDGIKGLNTSLKAAIAEISEAIRNYEELTEDTDYRNPYEAAINQYFKEVYIPYNEGLTALYDKLGERPDSERQSLIYEQIKLYNNSYAGTTFYLNDDTTVPFPSPLDWKWQGRTPEEQQVKRQQWLTRPLEWIDQDSTRRIVENNPDMSEFLPTTDEHFTPYREWTLARVEIDEMLESNTITPGQATKMRKALDAQLRERLIASGRAGEVIFMDLSPLEKLEVAGDLPPQLGVFGDMVRYYKQALAAEEVSAGSTQGRLMVAPLYDYAETLAYGDPQVMEAMLTLGENLLDKTTLDSILPWLFFDSRSER